MIVRLEGDLGYGVRVVTEIDGEHPQMLMDVATLRLRAGESHRSAADRERAFLLLIGEVELAWDGTRQQVCRTSFLHEDPWVLHVPGGVDVRVTAPGDPLRLPAGVGCGGARGISHAIPLHHLSGFLRPLRRREHRADRFPL